MPAVTYSLLIERGATFSQHLVWRDSEDDLIDLTGYTARMQIRPKPAGAVILELTDVNGRIVLGGTAGTIDLSITAADTSTLPSGTYVYDLELVNGTTVYRLMQGTLTVSPDITI